MTKSPSFDEISALLAREIYHYYKAGVIAGSADIDLSFMGYCANYLKMTVQDVENLWERIYHEEYKKDDTRAVYARTVSMASNGEPTTGGAKWRESLANRELDFHPSLKPETTRSGRQTAYSRLISPPH